MLHFITPVSRPANLSRLLDRFSGELNSGRVTPITWHMSFDTDACADDIIIDCVNLVERAFLKMGADFLGSTTAVGVRAVEKNSPRTPSFTVKLPGAKGNAQRHVALCTAEVAGWLDDDDWIYFLDDDTIPPVSAGPGFAAYNGPTEGELLSPEQLYFIRWNRSDPAVSLADYLAAYDQDVMMLQMRRLTAIHEGNGRCRDISIQPDSARAQLGDFDTCQMVLKWKALKQVGWPQSPAVQSEPLLMQALSARRLSSSAALAHFLSFRNALRGLPLLHQLQSPDPDNIPPFTVSTQKASDSGDVAGPAPDWRERTINRDQTRTTSP